MASALTVTRSSSKSQFACSNSIHGVSSWFSSDSPLGGGPSSFLGDAGACKCISDDGEVSGEDSSLLKHELRST